MNKEEDKTERIDRMATHITIEDAMNIIVKTWYVVFEGEQQQRQLQRVGHSNPIESHDEKGVDRAIESNNNVHEDGKINIDVCNKVASRDADTGIESDNKAFEDEKKLPMLVIQQLSGMQIIISLTQYLWRRRQQ